MGGITLKNPVVNSVPTAIALGKKGVDDNGKSLSTGRKANNDVVSSFLGNGLGDKAAVLSKVLGNIGYSLNTLKIAQDNLSSIAATLTEMIGLIAQVGGSDEATRTLNDMLGQKMEQVKKQIESSEYDGRKLLTGDLGSDSTVRTKFNTKPVDVRGALPAVAGFTAASVAGAASFNVAGSSNIATGSSGDHITVGGIKFTFVGANPDYAKNQILKGATDQDTARNIVTAIKNSKEEGLKAFNVDVFGSSVVVRQRSAGSGASANLLSSAPAKIAVAAPSSETITFGAAATATDSFTIGGVAFAFKATGQAANTYGPQEVDLGADQNISAANLTAKILAHPSTADLIKRGLLSVTIPAAPAAAVTIQSAGGKGMINLVKTGGGAGVIADVAAGSTAFIAKAGSVDVSGITNIDDFIGKLKPTFAVTNYDTSVNAKGTYTQLTGVTPAAVADPADTVVVLSTTIAGKVFQAVVFRPVARVDLTGLAIKFTNQESGQSFTVTPSADIDISTEALAGTNLATPLKNLFEGASFAQTRDLTINTDGGDIVVEGASVGSVEGMTVSLNSTSFADKKFEGFAVAQGTAAGSVKLTATIEGVQFEADNLLPAGLVKGTAVVLTSTDGDKLTINLGEQGLATALSSVTNYAAVSKAITDALTSSGAGLDVRVGLSLDDQLKVQIPDVSTSRLYRDNTGHFHATLSVLDKAGITAANECVKNALAVVRSAQASIQGQAETVEAASTSLSSALAVTKDASDGYLDTDLVQAASAFAASLKSIMAAISTLQAGARVADAGLEIIKSAAQ